MGQTAKGWLAVVCSVTPIAAWSAWAASTGDTITAVVAGFFAVAMMAVGAEVMTR